MFCSTYTKRVINAQSLKLIWTLLSYRCLYTILSVCIKRFQTTDIIIGLAIFNCSHRTVYETCFFSLNVSNIVSVFLSLIINNYKQSILTSK
jgi:hypothetical protein